MNRSPYLTAGVVLLCSVFLMRLLNPTHTSAHAQVGRVASENQWSSYMPDWLRWASSEEGQRALHHSPHVGAPGLLMALGEDPTITVTPRAPGEEVPGEALLPATIPCTLNGTLATLEPKTGDPNAPYLGVVQPMIKLPRSIAFAPAGGQGGSDLVVNGYRDQAGIFGANGGSAAAISVHYKNAVAGTPDCVTNLEFGAPSVTDGNGVAVVGFELGSADLDPTTGNIFVTWLALGSSSSGGENAAVVGVTNATTLESTACAGAKEGAAKNSACIPVTFPILSATFNVTMNTGAVIEDVKSTTDGAGSAYVAVHFRALASGTDVIDVAKCTFPITGASSCSSLAEVGIGTSSDPFTGLSVAATPAAVYFAVNQGSLFSQILSFISCTHSFPPSCGSPTTVTTFTPLVGIPGQRFSGSQTPHIAISTLGTIGVANDVCLVPDVSTPWLVNICPTPAIQLSQSTNGGATWTQVALPTEKGWSYDSNLAAVSGGNFLIPHLNTGIDPSGEPFTVNLITVPPKGTATVTTVTSTKIYPSKSFSDDGANWAPPVISNVDGGVCYLQFDSTNFSGTWGGVTEGRQTNAMDRLTGQ